MILKRKDLAKRWGVCERTVDRWIREKDVPKYVSMTGRYWFDEEEIKEWETEVGLPVQMQTPGKRD